MNLASRLEGQGEIYGVGIVVGMGAARQIDDEFALVEVDRVRVMGKAEPERVYGLLGDERMRADVGFQAVERLVQSLHERYRARDWDGVRSACAELRTHGERFGLTRLAEVYEGRAGVFEQDPPPADWDGVFVALTK